MNRGRIVVVAVVVLVTSVALAPAAAPGERFGGGPVGGHVIAGPHHFGPGPHQIGLSPHQIGLGSHHFGTRSFGRRFGPHAFGPRHFGPHSFSHRRFASFGLPVVVFAAPPLLYAASDAYAAPYPGPAYDEPPAYYSPPPGYEQPVVYAPPPISTMRAINTVAVAPAQPPAPSVVEFSSGRYELRGDGMTTPYTWVWIPNPPSSPPSTGASAEAPPSREGPRRSQLYRWTDEQGVVHLTDRWEAVPEQYRTQAKQARPS